ncbi:histidine phosphatase family protein [Paenisporosarcina sp. TG20]|uniref:histidine phosphatase family protein n=1 Tax=Paenisporosarcina sp. TG20 TaxID=1211706 RepID=UPI000306BE05|nr:histidine phosphatase family protein [Paenisporosarcina sp. TG20]
MELFFVRHGQGEHTLDLPQSLDTSDPALTKNGILQAEELREQLPLTEDDIVVISPIRRALQTALIWSDDVNCKKIVTPLVSPRMFPQKPNSKTLPCDVLLTKESIKKDFPSFFIDTNSSNQLWSKGLNTLNDFEFNALAEDFLEWYKKQDTKRIYIVSHDGTITAYRQFISGLKLSREDFLKETGWIKIDL